MNQKKARMLRKEAKFRVEEKRKLEDSDKYRDYIVEITTQIPIIDTRGEKAEFMGFKDSTAHQAITECVYGPYKEYKALKKLYYNPDANVELTILPSKEEEKQLADEMLAQYKRERHENNNTKQLGISEDSLHTIDEGRLQSSSCIIGSEENQEG